MKVLYALIGDQKPKCWNRFAVSPVTSGTSLTPVGYTLSFAGKSFSIPAAAVRSEFNPAAVTHLGMGTDAVGRMQFTLPTAADVADETALVLIHAHRTESRTLTKFTAAFENLPAEGVVAQTGGQIMLFMKPGERVTVKRSWQTARLNREEVVWVPEFERITVEYDGEELRAISGMSFHDVIGQEEAKKALSSIVKYLKYPQRLKQIGAKMPTGVLLSGEPGNGKTLLAKAVAGEAGVPFFHINGSDFINMYVGVGASKVRELFAKARQANSPALIFIDEIDTIGGKRGNGGVENSGSEHAQTLNALLSEMDGFAEHPHPIIVIGATNRPNTIDKALLRPGRFDRKVTVKKPKHADLVKLYEHYSAPLSLADGVDIEKLARKSIGLSAAGVAIVCNESALALFEADVHGRKGLKISQDMFETAIATQVRQHIGESRGKRFNMTEESIKLADVIGQDAAKEDVQDIINYLKDPASFHDQGARVPRGTLFIGPPGEGKTLLARAVAGEAGVPFFSISGSEFVEMFVGVGASRVRELFEEARSNAPCILFIDEIDAIGKRRSGGRTDGGSDERESTLNQLLVEMDGFNQSPDPVIVLAATNRKDTLDPALLRPGRLDREAVFYQPDMPDRLKLFEYYMRDKKLANDVNLEFFARNTFRFSAASIANICNEATLQMVRKGEKEITAATIDAAITRVTIGSPRKFKAMTETEKRNIAVHETWHAGAWHVESGGEPIARITIQAAGDSGGHVQTLNDDQRLVTRKQLFARVVMALAARAGQRIVLETEDVGASSDLKQARAIAYAMVVEYGMSELGPVSMIEGVDYSPELKAKIEFAVDEILQQAEQRAEEIITQYRANGDAVVEALLKKETLLGPEFVEVWNSATASGGEPAPVAMS